MKKLKRPKSPNKKERKEAIKKREKAQIKKYMREKERRDNATILLPH